MLQIRICLPSLGTSNRTIWFVSRTFVRFVSPKSDHSRRGLTGLSLNPKRQLARRDERQAGLAEGGKGKLEEAGEREGVSLRWVWEVRASDSISFCVREHTCLSSIIIVNNYGKIEVRHTHGVDRPDGARNPGRDVRALATFKNPSQGD